MTNAAYYKFERELIEVIKASDPETLRGALSGAIRSGSNANFNRSLHAVLRDNADPQSELRKALDALEVA